MTTEVKAKSATDRKFLLVVVAVLVVAILVTAVLAILRSGRAVSDEEVSASAPSLFSDNGFYVDENGVAMKKPALADTKQLVVLFDPQCPGCKSIHDVLGDLPFQLMKENKYAIKFVPLSFLDQVSSDGYSSRATSAIWTVVDKSPDHTLAFINKLFKNQPGEGAEYKPVTDDMISEWAVQVGVPKSVTNTFKNEKWIAWSRGNTQSAFKNVDFFPSTEISTPRYAMFKNGEWVQWDYSAAKNNDDVRESFKELVK